MVLNGVIPVISVVTVFIELFVFKPGIMYGVTILSLCQALIAWPMVWVLIMWERKYMLPAPPARGHGIILLLFWTGMFALQNLSFFNINNPSWFFQLKTFKDIILFSLFIAKYSALGGVFVLGLKAPGIPSIRHSESFTRLHPSGEEDGNADNNSSQGSPFRNLGKKIKLLAPFIWPSKSALLQFYVVVSVGLLVLGRLTNVFVPLYSKKIG
jgi:ATP-binding cassette subfamily B (MDR/TAP) protein 6